MASASIRCSYLPFNPRLPIISHDGRKPFSGGKRSLPTPGCGGRKSVLLIAQGGGLDLLVNPILLDVVIRPLPRIWLKERRRVRAR